MRFFYIFIFVLNVSFAGKLPSKVEKCFKEKIEEVECQIKPHSEKYQLFGIVPTYNDEEKKSERKKSEMW